MARILIAFDRFPKEGALIGRLLAGYADIEIGLMHCVQVARGDFDSVIKTMFRTRGETQRILVADALGRHEYRALSLGTEFEMAIGNVRYCLKIRNQYAHCVWWDDNTGDIAFANLEEIAIEHDYLTDLQSLTSYHVDARLLTEQLIYFEYTDDLLRFVNFEGRIRSGSFYQKTLSRSQNN